MEMPGSPCFKKTIVYITKLLVAAKSTSYDVRIWRDFFSMDRL